ncbi:MAG: hypothetical protein WA210_09060 [Burkholderiaceae bacterium]
MEIAELTEAEAHVIGHSLGINQTGREFRNHFVAEPGHDDYETLLELVRRNLMSRRTYALAPDCFVFHVTDAGRAALRARSTGHARPE